MKFFANPIKTIFLPLIACGVLASCASLIGPRQREVPIERLQEGLNRRFPLNNRAMVLLDVQLTHPQLTMLPESGRVALSVDASIAPAFTRQSWSGSLAMSGRLVIDNARNAVFIDDARVDSVNINGVDDERQRQFKLVANLVADSLIRDVPVYSFRPEDLRIAGVQFVPTGIMTTSRGLVVNFEPVR
ncbi:DUF1439 domain-containing protein [Undibacterium sp.]|jgi:hypothetical protein|uniref:DUF1439 domain-containing protein n=1 Tax=Undibacterium sp. TaxID=1914977 RepID=UPI002C6C0641|nr:DUF1439 domain-containing protein [Undibacterium sp.]HTD05117.1 DUF1439 domain-containing protein [Undibacterium sp.]